MPRQRLLPHLLVGAHPPLVDGQVTDKTGLSHIPLPYIVVLRGAVDADLAPQRWERHVVAYSVQEALLQAILEVGGTMSVDDVAKSKFNVESITPDIAEYWRLVVSPATEAAFKK